MKNKIIASVGNCLQHMSKRIYLGKELQVIDILAIYSSKPLQDIRHCPQINWLWSSHFRSPVGLCCFLHHFIYCFLCQQLCIKQIQIKQLQSTNKIYFHGVCLYWVAGWKLSKVMAKQRLGYPNVNIT